MATDYTHYFNSLLDKNTSTYLTNVKLSSNMTDVIRSSFDADVEKVRENLLYTPTPRSRLSRLAFANVNMSGLAGSQLWTLDMVRYLKKGSIESIIFSESSRQEVDENVTNSVDDVLNFAPEVIQVHHFNAAQRLVEATEGRSVPIVNMVHGVLPSPGLPGPRHIVKFYSAASVASRAKVHLLTGVPINDISIIPNFYDPSRFSPLDRPHENESALLFSSRTQPEQREILDSFFRELSIPLAHLGSGGLVTSRPEDFLRRFSIVFAVGRSAIEALASGCRVVLWDDGIVGPMVTPRNFWEVVASNFALVSNMLPWRSIYSPEAKNWLFEQLESLSPEDLETVTSRVRSTLTIENVSRQVLGLLNKSVS